MNKIVFMFLLLGASFLGAQDASTDDQLSSGSTPSPRQESNQNSVAESGAFFDLTLNSFVTSMRAYRYSIPSASQVVDQNDGTKKAFYRYSASLRFEWVVGSETGRIRSVAVIGSNFNRAEDVRSWINTCSTVLSVFYPKLNALERLSIVNKALSEGTSGYEDAALAFTDNGEFVMTISITGDGA